MKFTNKLWHKLVFVVMAIAIFPTIVACKKSGANIKVFEYETMDDGNIKITGLTDKGKNDSKLTIPSQLDGKNVTIIESGAFKDNTNVTEVVVSDGVKSINSNVFYNCKALEKITIPQSVEIIGMKAFANTRWESVEYESHTEIVVNNILVGVKEGLSEYTIPEAVKIIASGVFYNNTEIKSITLNNNIEKIGDYAFSGCTQITELNLPDSVKTIGYCSFSNNTQLDISIPSTVEQVGTDAFLGVKHLSYSGSLKGSPWGATEIN